MTVHRCATDETRREREEFERRVAESGIARFLTNEALMLLFLAFGPKMWRQQQ